VLGERGRRTAAHNTLTALQRHWPVEPADVYLLVLSWTWRTRGPAGGPSAVQEGGVKIGAGAKDAADPRKQNGAAGGNRWASMRGRPRAAPVVGLIYRAVKKGGEGVIGGEPESERCF